MSRHIESQRINVGKVFLLFISHFYFLLTMWNIKSDCTYFRNEFTLVACEYLVCWQDNNQQNSFGFQCELFSLTKSSAFCKTSECDRNVRSFQHRSTLWNGTQFTPVHYRKWLKKEKLDTFCILLLKNIPTIGLQLMWKWKTIGEGKRRNFVIKTWILPLTSCMTLSKSLISGSTV